MDKVSVMWIQEVFDICTDNDARRRLHALMKGDMREFEALDDASRNLRKERAEPGDKISGVGYCHDAPGGIVYHVDHEGRAYCVTIRGVDGLLAQECYKVFGKVDFVPGMLEAYRNIVIGEMADWLRNGANGWDKDSFDEAANAMLKLMKKTMEDA